MHRVQVHLKWKPESRCCWRSSVGSKGDVSMWPVSGTRIRYEKSKQHTRYCNLFPFTNGTGGVDKVSKQIRVEIVLGTARSLFSGILICTVLFDHTKYTPLTSAIERIAGRTYLINSTYLGAHA